MSVVLIGCPHRTQAVFLYNRGWRLRIRRNNHTYKPLTRQTLQFIASYYQGYEGNWSGSEYLDSASRYRLHSARLKGMGLAMIVYISNLEDDF